MNGCYRNVRAINVVLLSLTLLCGCRMASLFDLPEGTAFQVTPTEEFGRGALIFYGDSVDCYQGMYADHFMGRFGVKRLHGEFYEFQESATPPVASDSALVSFAPRAYPGDSIQIQVNLNPNIESPLSFERYCLLAVVYTPKTIEKEYVLPVRGREYHFEYRFLIPDSSSVIILHAYPVTHRTEMLYPGALRTPFVNLGVFLPRPGCDMNIMLPRFDRKAALHAVIDGDIFRYKDGKIYWKGVVFERLKTRITKNMLRVRQMYE